MCGRFQFHFENREQKEWLKAYYPEMDSFHFLEGERFPSQSALLFVLEQNKVVPKLLKWGFQGERGNRLINARAETLHQRPTFQRWLENRCVIVTNGFYEWRKEGKRKVKYHIGKKDRYLYLAGLYNDAQEFVIIICAAYGEMADYHDRCPLVLTRDQMIVYLKLGTLPDCEQCFTYTKCQSDQ